MYRRLYRLGGFSESQVGMSASFSIRQKRARCLIRHYLAVKKELRNLGVLRSGQNVEGEYAEWVVTNLLHLTPASTGVQKAYDARDKRGRTYQIKSRQVKSLQSNTSFDFVNIAARFDYLVCVFFSPSLEPLGIVRVPYKGVCELGSQTQRTFRFRWNKRTANDARVEKLFWQGETQPSCIKVRSIGKRF